jgi:hypothetical protein
MAWEGQTAAGGTFNIASGLPNNGGEQIIVPGVTINPATGLVYPALTLGDGTTNITLVTNKASFFKRGKRFDGDGHFTWGALPSSPALTTAALRIGNMPIPFVPLTGGADECVLSIGSAGRFQTVSWQLAGFMVDDTPTVAFLSLLRPGDFSAVFYPASVLGGVGGLFINGGFSWTIRGTCD